MISLTCYRPQRSCGQGNVFTGVCLSTGGRVSASVHAGMPDPPRSGRPPWDQADTPWTRKTPPQDQADTPPDQADTPPDQADTPPDQTPPRDQADPPRPGRHPPDQAETHPP